MLWQYKPECLSERLVFLFFELGLRIKTVGGRGGYFWHKSNIGVKIGLHAGNQQPRCHGSVLKVCGVMLWRLCGGETKFSETLWPKAWPLELCFVHGPSLSIFSERWHCGRILFPVHMGQYSEQLSVECSVVL